MKRRTVIWSPEARADLLRIEDYISGAGSPVNALRVFYAGVDWERVL